MKPLILLLAGLLLFPCAPAQEAPLQSSEKELTTLDMPQWLIEFSNLPGDQRENYLRNFAQAKLAFQEGRWTDCYSHLANCELIFNKNPNVWNLRASCLMEQKFFDEAAAELQKAQQAMPHDPVTVLNLASLHMATGQYEKSIEVIDELWLRLPEDSPSELTDVLTYRKLLAMIQLGRLDEAKKLIRHVNALSDTPLYYYSRAAISLAEGNKQEAARCLRIVKRIFTKGNTLVPYQRALELSRLGTTSETPH